MKSLLAWPLIGLSVVLPLFVACGGGAELPPGSGGTGTVGSGGSLNSGGTGQSTGTGGSAAAAGGGASSSGGATAGGGGSTGGGPGSDVVPSAGCSVPDGATTLTAGGASVSGGASTSTRLSIMSDGASRDYIIDIPEDYDPSKPYRLIFSWHQAYGSANGNAIGQQPAFAGPNFNAENYAYFGLRREANASGEPAIFVAPQGIGNFPWDFNRDVQLFDALLERVSENLCIDESRVFTTGFSFGAMMSYSLSITRQEKLRGAVTMAAANYNLPGQPTDSGGGKIAYFGITGMSDGTCPWVNDEGAKRGGKFCALIHAEDNGCTIPGNIETVQVGSKDYLCYDFEGCEDGYPVKVCTFDGAHTPSSVNDGTTNGDDGADAFTPPLAWDFISSL